MTRIDPVNKVAGVLLAGGASSRYGSNKAFAPLGDSRLIEYPARVLAELFETVLLITNTPAEYAFLGWPMTGDKFTNAGPLAGIHAALSTLTVPSIFVAGCDMPFLDPKLIRYLCTLAPNKDVIIPRTSQGFEPLHAVYRQSCLPVLTDHLTRNNRAVTRVLADLTVREVSEVEIIGIAGNLESFRNINRPEDLPGKP
ncbi:MAG: molybdenum cofactor guanylyltransferase [Proteobacteria bacterium]|nr:molybdenum cofactor guanylyltransferase [Pseudomonadota bacterium]MBU1687175.1 molybdenum cofactor guanylyltransferase [Pseudomonadota bacterium]